MNPLRLPGKLYRWIRGGHWELWLVEIGDPSDPAERGYGLWWLRRDECFHASRQRPFRAEGRLLRCEDYR